MEQLLETVQFSDAEWEEIWATKPTYKHKIMMFGRLVDIPRTQVFFGPGEYKFAGTSIKAQDDTIPFYVQRCLDYVKIQEPEINWNAALVNFYDNGMQYIGAHSDSLIGLDPKSSIWSFSFGGQRVFRIRKKDTREIVKNFITYNGSVIKMSLDMQSEFTHEIVKTKKLVEPRLNVTIRGFVV